MKGLASLLPVSLLLCGCPPSDRLPGDENLGTYALTAEGLSAGCGLKDIAATGFDFTATVTRFRDGGRAFVTLNGITGDAGFDGQIVSTTRTAARTFTLPDGGNCAPGCDMRLVESMSFALLSKSQSAALFERCPANPLDGGIPSEDAGVTLPGSTSTGFDSVRVCGELHEDIVGVGSCDPLCNSCQLQYRLTGERR